MLNKSIDTDNLVCLLCGSKKIKHIGSKLFKCEMCKITGKRNKFIDYNDVDNWFI